MKRIFALTLCGLLLGTNLSLGVLAIEDAENFSASHVEHIMLPKKLAKKTPTNIANVTAGKSSIAQYNTLQVVFAQDFNGKTAKVGDEVAFMLKDDVRTIEGSKLLPASTKIITQISNIEKPKAFNRTGKIYLDFKYMELPDGTQLPIRAKLFGKNDFLSRGKLNALGKGLGSVLGGIGVGIGAGCGIGIAASAVIIGGFAIGLPVGFAVGAVAGLVTPGLNYKAKAGDKVDIQLLNNLDINK